MTPTWVFFQERTHMTKGKNASFDIANIERIDRSTYNLLVFILYGMYTDKIIDFEWFYSSLLLIMKKANLTIVPDDVDNQKTYR